MFDLDRLKAECSAAVAGRGGLQAIREVIARTKANASPYPASLQRDTIRAPEVRGRMRRREFIVGLAMLTNAHGASAQGRARRVGALVVEQTQADILETVLKQKRS